MRPLFIISCKIFLKANSLYRPCETPDKIQVPSCVVAHACNPSSQESEAGKLYGWGKPELHCKKEKKKQKKHIGSYSLGLRWPEALRFFFLHGSSIRLTLIPTGQIARASDICCITVTVVSFIVMLSSYVLTYTVSFFRPALCSYGVWYAAHGHIVNYENIHLQISSKK